MPKSEMVRRKIHEKPDILIGKNGVTPGLIQEIENQLEKKKILKIKALKNIAQTKKDFLSLLEEIEEKIDIEISDIRGKTAIIRKKKKNTRSSTSQYEQNKKYLSRRKI